MIWVKRKSNLIGNCEALMHTSEPSTSNRGGRHPHRGCHEHRSEGRVSHDAIGVKQGAAGF